MIDFLLVAALEKEFFDDVRAVFAPILLPKGPGDTRTYFAATLQAGPGSYSIRMLCVGRKGGQHTVAAVQTALRKWRPRHVIMFGIAAVVPGKGRRKQHILVADAIIDVPEHKVVRSGSTPRPDPFPCEDELINHLLLTFPNRKWLHVGAIISQPHLIRSAKYRDTLVGSVRGAARGDIIGVEMEGGGLATAVREQPQRERPGMLLVKGAVDWANYHKDSRLHRKVALRTVRFLKRFLASAPVAVRPQPGAAGMRSPVTRPGPRGASSRTAPSARLGNAPLHPGRLVGRSQDLRKLQRILGAAAAPQRRGQPVRVAIRGWPGVGKTSVARALAHDTHLQSLFPDGSLWVSLGPTPDVTSELSAWGRHLRLFDIDLCRTPTEASGKLRSLVQDKRLLIIVDDVWSCDDALPFLIGGRSSATIFTTRETKVADTLSEGRVYRLRELSPKSSLALLAHLAPRVVARYPRECRGLVTALEGLPLALNVAGRLLRVEAARLRDVTQLLSELASGGSVLALEIPPDQRLLEMTTPTVAALLRKSTDRLPDRERHLFARLGVLPPTPAHFSVEMLQGIWQTARPMPVVDTLIDRGLLEPVQEGRFEMHALLVLHARSLLEE